VLDRSNGNQSRAAQVLGIHRNTLSRKIDEYKLASGNHRSR
jgi:DNA-binding protein Fis